MPLRKATLVDDAFCFRFHEAAMRDYVEPIYGWEDGLQRNYQHRCSIPTASRSSRTRGYRF